MTVNIDLSPQTSERLTAAAKNKGVDTRTLVTTLVEEHLPPLAPTPQDARQTIRSVDPENDASITLLESWLAEAPTDPDEIREAEEDLAEFKRNMNLPRKQAGARLLYPEVETE